MIYLMDGTKEVLGLSGVHTWRASSEEESSSAGRVK